MFEVAATENVPLADRAALACHLPVATNRQMVDELDGWRSLASA